MVLEFIVVILIGYLLGSVPFGLIIGKVVKGIDVREYGSGNIGFTNVLRSVGKKSGAATLVLDMGKGAVPAWLGGQIVGGDSVAVGQIVAALAAVVGHNWSVYLKFSGGKGVDTSTGALFAMNPLAGIATTILGVSLMIKTGYVSVGSMAGGVIASLVLLPMIIFWDEPVEYIIYAMIATVLILFRHRGNIARLRAGTEHRLGQKGTKK